MNLGVLTVRDETYHPNQRLLAAGASRGHRVELVNPYTVWPSVGASHGAPTRARELGRLDAALPRQGATIGDSSLALIRHLGRTGVPLINNLEAILVARDKFFTAQTLERAGLPVPPTHLANCEEGFREALEFLGGFPVVVKPAMQRQGEGVGLLENRADLEARLANAWDRRAGLLVQRFYPPSRRRDIRVLVVGARVAGAVELTPRPGDFRVNLHVGGVCRATRLDARLEQLALGATRALGLEVAGVDLLIDRDLGPMVLEVNYSPGFRGLEAVAGIDAAGEIIDYTVAVCRDGAARAG